MPANRRSKRKADEVAQSTAGSPPAPASSDTRALESVERTPAKKRASSSKKQPLSRKKERSVTGNLEDDSEMDGIDEEEIEDAERVVEKPLSPKQRKGVSARAPKEKGEGEDVNGGYEDACFLGDPVAEDEARERWPQRYSKKKDDDDLKAKRHYVQARVDGCVYNINDDAYVKAGENEPHYIGRIMEMFETCDHELYFTAQWFFRAEDTVIKEHSCHHDARRVFLSDDQNDNALNCIVRKVRILRLPPKVGPVKEEELSGFELYYDMSFSVAYSSFVSLPSDVKIDIGRKSSTITSCSHSELSKDETISTVTTDKSDSESDGSTNAHPTELSLLDLFSGCGAMSSGLCLGANLAGVRLRTSWAVDMNQHACKSLQINHPKTEVRNEKAEDFLELIREWEVLCQKYGKENDGFSSLMDDSDEEEELKEKSKMSAGEFEVEKLVGVCYGKTENLSDVGLKFKVRWKGYGPSEDTWEPVDGLSDCQEKIKDFVRQGYKKRILPLPGMVDVICGGPPCQGISGFNRFRNTEDPFKDVKNKQMAVFTQIVEFLRPNFVLMENVVDILKFAKGHLGRYALSKLVAMNYQARLGILAAGNYGLPQYRMRVFLWGAHPAQKLPQFPLPTHDVIVRGGPPVEFEGNVVAYDGSQQQHQLEKALRLFDALSDLPSVKNDECRDEMSYGGDPKTDFQKYIRLSKEEMIHPSSHEERQAKSPKLFDHRPLQLNQDDYQRVCRIPKNKGANFRDLPGVMVGLDNVVQWDPKVDRVLLPSGKQLVPDYAMSFINGKSSKPFGRLWWDETVPTVVTRAEPHNQIIIHPEQDRVLTVRENARLQGFPDFYKLSGPIKERYIQVGNAVAFPVSRALGYAFGLSYHGKVDEEPVLVLPQKFPMKI